LLREPKILEFKVGKLETLTSLKSHVINTLKLPPATKLLAARHNYDSCNVVAKY
jgi:hypothetical protein